MVSLGFAKRDMAVLPCDFFKVDIPILGFKPESSRHFVLKSLLRRLEKSKVVGNTVDLHWDLFIGSCKHNTSAASLSEPRRTRAGSLEDLGRDSDRKAHAPWGKSWITYGG